MRLSTRAMPCDLKSDDNAKPRLRLRGWSKLRFFDFPTSDILSFIAVFRLKGCENHKFIPSRYILRFYQIRHRRQSQGLGGPTEAEQAPIQLATRQQTLPSPHFPRIT